MTETKGGVLLALHRHVAASEAGAPLQSTSEKQRPELGTAPEVQFFQDKLTQRVRTTRVGNRLKSGLHRRLWHSDLAIRDNPFRRPTLLPPPPLSSSPPHPSPPLQPTPPPPPHPPAPPPPPRPPP